MNRFVASQVRGRDHDASGPERAYGRHVTSPPERFAVSLLLAAVTTGLLVTAGPASGSVKPPEGIPDLSQMALTAAELPHRATVLEEGYRDPDTSVAAYERMFRFSRTAQRRSGLVFLDSDVALEKSADAASLEVTAIRLALRDPATRRDLGRVFAAAAGVRARKVRVGKARTLRVGDGAVALPLTVTTSRGKVGGVFSFMAVDRVVAQANPLAVRHRRGLMHRTRGLLNVTAEQVRAGLSPVSTSPPTITGTAVVGAVLQAAPGAWGEATKPTGFAYQWQRCDDTGAACIDVAGATAIGYAVTDADKGGTLRLAVTARNDVGQTTAVSIATGVIP